MVPFINVNFFRNDTNRFLSEISSLPLKYFLVAVGVIKGTTGSLISYMR